MTQFYFYERVIGLSSRFLDSITMRNTSVSLPRAIFCPSEATRRFSSPTMTAAWSIRPSVVVRRRSNSLVYPASVAVIATEPLA